MPFKKVKLKILSFLMFLILSINFAVPASAEGNSPYIKNSVKPKFLYVIKNSNLTDAESTMISSLQGIASKSREQIYILDKSHPSYSIWLKDIKKNYKIKCEVTDDPWYLLDKFKHLVKGYVLYECKNAEDPSINNACSLASLKDSITVDKSIEKDVKSHGITELTGDCRNTDKYWAFNNLWNAGLNHSTVIELNPKRVSALRDYAIMTKSLVFYDENKEDTALRDRIFSSMPKNSICLGWGPDEFKNVAAASKQSINIVPADWSYNLTVLSSFPSCPLKQKASKLQEKISSKSPAHYVTFIMSDGDNQQWNLGTNFSSTKWYGSKFRGKIQMGWSVSPSLYYMAPTVLKMYYRNALKDSFLVSPSGMGYMYPSKFGKNALDLQAKQLNEYMKNADQRYLCVIDDSALDRNDIWDRYTKEPNIKGIFYLDYKRQDNYKGKIISSRGKPVVSCRNLLWSGIEDENSLVKNINNYVEKGFTDVNEENAYTTVYVHAWSKNLEQVCKVQDKLKKNPKIKIVPPDTFMELIHENVL